jgi:3-methyladenine DNA glycosylase AlkD
VTAYQLLLQNFIDLKNPKKAQILSRFFKTYPGQYGQGDLFLGIVVPLQRDLVARFWDSLTLKETEKLLHSKYHEHRLTALLILVKKYQKGDWLLRQKIFDLYLQNTRYINNWDLVDLSAPNIVGTHLLDKPRTLLKSLARSDSLWERRISLLACFPLIKNHDFTPLLALSKILITDSHDLIHKALGWMLREMGKVDQLALISYLDQFATKLPRTALRYSIEKLPQTKRQFYLKQK